MELDLSEAIRVGGNELFGFNTTAGLHFVIHHSDGDGYQDIARVVLEAAAPLIERAVRAQCWHEQADHLSDMARRGVHESTTSALEAAAAFARGMAARGTGSES